MLNLLRNKNHFLYRSRGSSIHLIYTPLRLSLIINMLNNLKNKNFFSRFYSPLYPYIYNMQNNLKNKNRLRELLHDNL
nr:MAG TPA: hypothetical protein [Caudoviricetes sp.]